jgi:hypothetical protein
MSKAPIKSSNREARLLPPRSLIPPMVLMGNSVASVEDIRRA